MRILLTLFLLALPAQARPFSLTPKPPGIEWAYHLRLEMLNMELRSAEAHHCDCDSYAELLMSISDEAGAIEIEEWDELRLSMSR